MGLHFQESADRAFEFKTQACPLVKAYGWTFCRDDHFDIAIVELIDHVNPPSGLVTAFFIQCGDAANEHGVEERGNFNVVIVRAWGVA